MDGAIEGMLSMLGDENHTFFLPPKLPIGSKTRLRVSLKALVPMF
jgi:hypothetical protein